MKKKHVVMFSTGSSSAWLAKYVVDTYGKENTDLLITDTKWEDEDNYRFLHDVEDYVGKKVTWMQDGRTPEDIFDEELYFGNFGTAPCSKELKMKQTFIYVQDLINQGYLPILYFGIGYGEIQRAPRIAFNYKHNIDVFEDGVEVRFPLIGSVDAEDVNGNHLFFNTPYFEGGDMPKMRSEDIYKRLEKQNFKPRIINTKRIISEEWGIKLPKMYELGFSHANCAGRCIKGGKKHYTTLYKVWPERYKEQEEMEKRINEAQKAKGNKPYTILSRVEDGVKKPYTLEEFRKEVLDSDRQIDIFDFIQEDEKPCECVF